MELQFIEEAKVCQKNGETIGSLEFIGLLLLSQGIESNPGPWSILNMELGPVSLVGIVATCTLYYMYNNYKKQEDNGNRSTRQNEDKRRRELMQKVKERYLVSDSHGFVINEPEERLPKGYEQYEELARNLNKYVQERRLRSKVDQLRLPASFDIENLSKKELMLGHIVFSFITMGYVWQNGDKDVVNTLPKCIAIPLCQISEKLGVKPIIAYPSMILANWRMVRSGPHEMQNLRTFYETPGGEGASWFILTHNCIEVKFAPAIRIILYAMTFAEEGNIIRLTEVLKELPAVFKDMMKIFKRIEERVDPVHFYDRLRHFYSGWDSGSKIPELKAGLIYEGMYDNKPQEMKGGSAAQSTTLQIVDAALGIEHEGGQKAFIEEVRNYMLKEHRDFINYVQLRSFIRDTVRKSGNRDLVKAYNTCIQDVISFRKFHLNWIVKKYITDLQNREANAQLRGVGTGGAGLGQFLDGVVETTRRKLIQEPS